jgi:hypothetical protein
LPGPPERGHPGHEDSQQPEDGTADREEIGGDRKLQVCQQEGETRAERPERQDHEERGRDHTPIRLKFTKAIHAE